MDQTTWTRTAPVQSITVAALIERHKLRQLLGTVITLSNKSNAKRYVVCAVGMRQQSVVAAKISMAANEAVEDDQHIQLHVGRQVWLEPAPQACIDSFPARRKRISNAWPILNSSYSVTRWKPDQLNSARPATPKQSRPVSQRQQQRPESQRHNDPRRKRRW